jgi:predicted tellurium resistance membrane protein TerC
MLLLFFIIMILITIKKLYIKALVLVLTCYLSALRGRAEMKWKESEKSKNKLFDIAQISRTREKTRTNPLAFHLCVLQNERVYK